MKTISIIGPIGSFNYVNEEGKVVHVVGVQLVDVIANVTKYEKEKELTVEIGSIGGSVPVAKQIRGFLKSIQPRIAVTTKQVGDIASSGTILFSSGSKRLAAKGINPETGQEYKFMVHSPWTPHFSGNADEMAAEAADLRLTEDEMVAMYQEDTGISREAIQPLMKAETYFNADKAVDLKLATETYKALNQAAYKPNNNMSKISKLALDAVLALLSDEDKVKVKAALAVAPPAELMGKAVMIDGKGATDGIYTVVGGVITAMESVQEEAAPAAATPATAQPAAAASINPAVVTAPPVVAAAITQEAIAKIVSDQVAAQMTLIKKSIKTEHVPVGFTPETKADDAKEWDRSFKANEHVAMKKNDPEKWSRLFYAKYGRMPNV